MDQENLSETLFKPKVFQKETSTLMRRHHRVNPDTLSSTLDGTSNRCWYRVLNKVMWIWRGAHPFELEQVLSRIVAAKTERSNPHLLDTVIGYRSGNWAYEWTHQGMEWQQKALETVHSDPLTAGHYWLKAANYYSIASYPHLRGDDLAEQAGALGNRAYEAASKLLTYEMKVIDFRVSGGRIKGFLYLPDAKGGPYPTLMLCNGLDNLQNDYHRLFLDHLAPAGIAMLCLDIPSVGFSSQWSLTQDTSCLHQQVLAELPSIPWIDHQRVALLGIRFGANIAVRLGYLESKRLCAVACIGPIVHHLLVDAKIQQQVPSMYSDILANRLRLDGATDETLSVELSRYSLKVQGLLGRRCSTPMLAAGWDNDIFSPLEESRLIACSSCDGRFFKVSSKLVHEGFYRVFAEMTSWVEGKLR